MCTPWRDSVYAATPLKTKTKTKTKNKQNMKYTSAAQFTVGTIFLIVRCEKMVHQIYRIYPVDLLFSFFMSD